jgi:DNA-binding CsgD family transcriptional regulator
MTPGRIDQLTEAQRACLRLVLTHHNSKEIAAIVGVSPSAIDKRVERAIQILGVGTRFEAARRLQDHERSGIYGAVLVWDRAPAKEQCALERPASQLSPAEHPAFEHQAIEQASSSPAQTYERLPSEPIDVPTRPLQPSDNAQIEPWGLARRFLGISGGSGSTGVARNRSSIGDRVIRLFALMGLIAVTSMALVNMAMTLTSLLRSNRDRSAPVHGTTTPVQRGGISMLRERRNAADRVASDFLKAEAAVDTAAMLTASCMTTLLRQRIAANLPVGTGAAALQMMSQASFDIINARQRFVEAHRALVDVRAEIGLGQFYGYGDTAECPPNEGALHAAADLGSPVRLAAVA